MWQIFKKFPPRGGRRLPDLQLLWSCYKLTMLLEIMVKWCCCERCHLPIVRARTKTTATYKRHLFWGEEAGCFYSEHLIQPEWKKEFNLTFVWPTAALAFKLACQLCHLWWGFPSMMRTCSPPRWGNYVAGLLQWTKKKKEEKAQSNVERARHFICFFSKLIMQKCHERCYR